MLTKTKPILAIAILNTLYVFATARSVRRNTTGLICNQRGYSDGIDAYYALAPPDFLNAYQYCQWGAGDTCRSFAYSDSLPGQLFNVTLSGNFVADDSSPYVFFDHECDQARMQCGLAGYSEIDARTVEQVDSLAACAAVCDQMNELYTTCFSYAFANDGSGQCAIYEYFVADNVNADPSSPYVFYDYLCDKSSNTTGATTIATTTAVSTTTTDLSSTASSAAATTNPESADSGSDSTDSSSDGSSNTSDSNGNNDSDSDDNENSSNGTKHKQKHKHTHHHHHHHHHVHASRGL